MERVESNGDSVNNGVPFMGDHASSQLLTEQDRIRRLLAAFLSGRNPRTIAAYGADLDDFRRFLGTGDIETRVRGFCSPRRPETPTGWSSATGPTWSTASSRRRRSTDAWPRCDRS